MLKFWCGFDSLEPLRLGGARMKSSDLQSEKERFERLKAVPQCEFAVLIFSLILLSYYQYCYLKPRPLPNNRRFFRVSTAASS